MILGYQRSAVVVPPVETLIPGRRIWRLRDAGIEAFLRRCQPQPVSRVLNSVDVDKRRIDTQRLSGKEKHGGAGVKIAAGGR